MAQLLVRSVDPEHGGRYFRGDIVVVADDDHQWGRCESLDVWVSEGLNPAEWPGGFEVVNLPGMNIAEAMKYVTQGLFVKRVWKCDLDSLASKLSKPQDSLSSTKEADPKSAAVMSAFESKNGVAVDINSALVLANASKAFADAEKVIIL